MAVNLFEELVRAALNAQGYLTFENAAYALYPNAKSLAGKDNPNNAASDIDLIGFAPTIKGPKRVLAINCKGSKAGLSLPNDAVRVSAQTQQPVAGCAPQTGFRELSHPDWAKAFRAAVYRCTGEHCFTHVTAVRAIAGPRTGWTQHQPFKTILTEHLAVWDLDDIVRKLRKGVNRIHPGNNTLKLVDLLRPAA